MIPAKEIRALLPSLDGNAADSLESETLEFKPWDGSPKARSSQLKTVRETVVCLANAHGGTIVLGIADRKRTRAAAIHGVGDLDVAAVRRHVYDGTEPHILVEIEEMLEPEGRILLVHVPRGLPPHTTTEGVGKIRVGKECKPLTGSALSRLLLTTGQRDLTAEALPGTSLLDLDPRQIEALQRTIEAEAGNRELARLPPAELLRNLGLVGEREVTLAAVLLLGRPAALARWVPQHEVIFLRFRTQTHYDARHDLRGPLLAVLEALRRLLEAHLRIASVGGSGFGEQTVPEVTWWVARESVLNALVHRDYFLHQSVQVELKPGRLEVSSPGGFIGGVNPKNVLRHPPVRRNPLLANVCQTIGLVNRAGLGVDRIYEDLLRLGKGMPLYEVDESHVRLSLPTSTRAGFARFVADETLEGRELGLDDLIVLRAVADLGFADRWSAAERLQLDDAAAAARLVSLRERGYLVPKGRGRGTLYRLAKQLQGSLGEQADAVQEAPFDDDALRLRLQAALAQRGHLTNELVRRLSGCSRPEVLRLMRRLRGEGLVRLVGRGRAARYVGGSRKGQARRARRPRSQP